MALVRVGENEWESGPHASREMYESRHSPAAPARLNASDDERYAYLGLKEERGNLQVESVHIIGTEVKWADLPSSLLNALS
jgi:hypothetical protein